jgi:hypothetical protein
VSITGGLSQGGPPWAASTTLLSDTHTPAARSASPRRRLCPRGATQSRVVAVGDPVELGPKSELALLETATWTERAKLWAACSILFDVTVRPDGAKIAASCADGSVQIWSVPKL